MDVCEVDGDEHQKWRHVTTYIQKGETCVKRIVANERMSETTAPSQNPRRIYTSRVFVGGTVDQSKTFDGTSSLFSVHLFMHSAMVVPTLARLLQKVNNG